MGLDVQQWRNTIKAKGKSKKVKVRKKALSVSFLHFFLLPFSFEAPCFAHWNSGSHGL
jgi:hypothetical protein